MAYEEEDIEISSSGDSHKEIVMSQLHKCINLSNVEFRGGYYSFIPTKDGEEKEIYVQDTREVFGNAVYALALLLIPRFDKKTAEKFRKYKAKIELIQAKFIEESSVEEDVILGESFYEKESDKILLETYKAKKLKLHLNLLQVLSEFLASINYMGMIGGVY